jgi:hypothetical protein
MLRNYVPAGISGHTGQKPLSSAHLSLVAICRLDIIHDINMDIVQYNTCLRGAGLPDNVPENDPSLGGRHLDRCLDTMEAVGGQRMRSRPLDKFHITERSEFNNKVLKRIGRLIHNENVWTISLSK